MTLMGYDGLFREKLLQSAAIKNQDFQNVSQSLDTFLNNLPDNTVSPSDDLGDVNAKQVSQEVDGIHSLIIFPCIT